MMVGVTIIAKGYTEKEILEIKNHYDKMDGFTVTVVGDMKDAVKHTMKVLSEM